MCVNLNHNQYEHTDTDWWCLGAAFTLLCTTHALTMSSIPVPAQEISVGAFIDLFIFQKIFLKGLKHRNTAYLVNLV